MNVISTDHLTKYNVPIMINQATKRLLENLEKEVIEKITDPNPLVDLSHFTSVLIENAVIKTYGINFDYRSEGLELDALYTDYGHLCEDKRIYHFAPIGKIVDDDGELLKPDYWGL